MALRRGILAGTGMGGLTVFQDGVKSLVKVGRCRLLNLSNPRLNRLQLSA